MRRKYNFILLIIIIMIFFLSIFTSSSDSGSKEYPIGPNITSSDNVLIFAPHPDDETLSSAGVIRYCVQNHVPVHVVVVTNGGTGKLSQIRHFETLNATAKLGLSSQNVTFLDYPQVVNNLFDDNWDPNHSYEDGPKHNSFAYQKNSSYNGVSLENNVESMINKYKPTIIIYPAFYDDNTDHWGTGAFVDYAINRMGYNAKMYTYLIHDDSTLWPFPRSYFPQSDLTPPAHLINQTNWFIFPLTSSDEQYKFDAVDSYQSQMKHDPVFLRSYIRKNELFGMNNNITVNKTNNSNDYINSTTFPETVFHEPTQDIITKTTDLLYSAFGNVNKYDIENVGFESDNNITWISVKTLGGISKNGIYQFHIRGFGDDGITRIDFEVQNGTANFYMPSSNSIHPHLLIRSNSDGIVVGIPDMTNKNSYMVDIETSNIKQNVDRTGYFTLKLS